MTVAVVLIAIAATMAAAIGLSSQPRLQRTTFQSVYSADAWPGLSALPPQIISTQPSPPPPSPPPPTASQSPTLVPVDPCKTTASSGGVPKPQISDTAEVNPAGRVALADVVRSPTAGSVAGGLTTTAPNAAGPPGTSGPTLPVQPLLSQLGLSTGGQAASAPTSTTTTTTTPAPTTTSTTNLSGKSHAPVPAVGSNSAPPPALPPTPTASGGGTPAPPSTALGCGLVGNVQIGQLEAGESPLEADVVAKAASLLGIRYVWGGASPSNGFDCSGLVQFVYREAGMSLPRVAQDQFEYGPAVRPGTVVEPGDLVFFGSSAQNVSHVGVYVGGGVMIDAPYTGSVVRFDPVEGPIVGVTSPAGT